MTDVARRRASGDVSTRVFLFGERWSNVIIADMSEPETILEQIAVSLYDIGAVQFGKYKLEGGQTARHYFDFRRLVSYPQLLKQVTVGYRTILDRLTFDLIAAPPLTALPIGTAISLDTNIPMIYPRKTANRYGTAKSIDGAWEVGQTAVIIDDVVSTGESILQAIVSLKAGGIQVNEAVVLIDRESHGIGNLMGSDYKVYSLFTFSRLMDILEEYGRITPKQHNKVRRSLNAETN